MALAADVLALGVSELGAISERRIEKLTNTAFSGLPPFLTADAGLNSGFMMAQVTAAALASENKTLCHPASVDSIPTSADKEDHVSMGMGAALKLRPVVANTYRIVAIELAAAAQGIDLLRPLRSSFGLLERCFCASGLCSQQVCKVLRRPLQVLVQQASQLPALQQLHRLLHLPLDRPHLLVLAWRLLCKVYRGLCPRHLLSVSVQVCKHPCLQLA